MNKDDLSLKAFAPEKIKPKSNSALSKLLVLEEKLEITITQVRELEQNVLNLHEKINNLERRKGK